MNGAFTIGNADLHRSHLALPRAVF